MKTYIAQGEQAIGVGAEDVVQAILGSCVAVCLWDTELRIGGMNHILLPEAASSEMGALGVGATAMERLINALMRRGADRTRFEAKVFGGAAIVAGLSDIGAKNTAFVMRYLGTERIPCVAQSTGGTMARHVRFWPATGRVRQRLVLPEQFAEPRLPERNASTEMELF